MTGGALVGAVPGACRAEGADRRAGGGSARAKKKNEHQLLTV